MESIAAGVVVIIVALLQWYLRRDRTYENLQKGRQDIVNGNTPAVSERVDRLLASETGHDPAAPLPSAEDVERRLGKL
ncbi:MAG: hypothetical protein HGA20_14925 [Geobacteraceae bacterium]|nr:hypothetical protein [Geobacteraceae bacterium]